MEIKVATFEDIPKIVELHYKAYNKSHFTSVLSPEMLALYYHEFLKINKICFLGYINGTPAGFVLGGDDVDTPLSILVSKHKIGIILKLLQNPRFIVEKVGDAVLNKIFPPKKSAEKIILLSIAVSPEYQRHKLGSALISKFEEEVIKEGSKSYALFVRKNNNKALSFYQKAGFTIENNYRQSFSMVKVLK